MSKTRIKVSMDGVSFTSDEETVLITKGVTTCIAFLVQGSFWDEDEDEIGFCGIYHWSGFNRMNITQNQQAKNALCYFLEKLRSFTGIENEEVITIDTLCFIGGEKEQRAGDNEVIVSGTEAEVYSLKKAVKEFNFTDHKFRINPKKIYHQHFLTEGEQSISIKLALDTIDCQIEIPETPVPDDSLDVCPTVGM
jgi:hypothetical protein